MPPTDNVDSPTSATHSDPFDTTPSTPSNIIPLNTSIESPTPRSSVIEDIAQEFLEVPASSVDLADRDEELTVYGGIEIDGETAVDDTGDIILPDEDRNFVRSARLATLGAGILVV